MVKLRAYKLILLLGLFLSLGIPASWALNAGEALVAVQGALHCDSKFASLEVNPGDTPYVFVDGVMVTGGDYYPVEVITKGLGYTETEIAALKGKKVLSVAEGYSGLLPYLQSRGVKAQGLDLWYHQPGLPDNEMGRAMRAYVDVHGDSLLQGSAFNIPLPENSVDEVVSHMLVNNISTQQGLTYLRDSVRVVKPGGTIRTAGYRTGNIERIKTLLKREFGDAIEIESRQVKASWSVGGKQLSHDDYLLVIRKK